ncbi:MAG TPA: hypothetical protein VF585_02085 [Chthoniobacterales bacterium]|jgi:SNF family Na+-dependent transporter
MPDQSKEQWSSRWGVIMAVAGSAIGLGNFLRFPGQVAQYGGAYMIAYFIALLLLGLPIGWAEWTMGRMGGLRGYHGAPGILQALGQRRGWLGIGVVGVIVPVVIYMYYVYIEAWCLGYAIDFFRGAMHFQTVEESSTHWKNYIGLNADGAAFQLGTHSVGPVLLFVFLLNFSLIYRGISRGIEKFCNFAMPTLIVMALIILVRVFTLGTPDPAKPEQSVNNGLGYMWNPTKTVLETQAPDNSWTRNQELFGAPAISAAKATLSPTQRVREISMLEQLLNPQMWISAAGQIFFSLSVGFGVIINYASYLRRKDDVVLSGLSAVSANEFAEVSLGGLITIPAAVAFLGVMGVAGMGTFGLGFNVLPMVFASMPFGQFFGGLFFFLLFLAAITSSISMLQPGIAFLEEACGIGRKQSVSILGCLTAVGALFVVYFSKDVKALDTLDFWVGTVLIYVLATWQILLFGWVIGIENGLAAAKEGAAIRIPRVFGFIMKYVSPLFLIAVFTYWMVRDVVGFQGAGLPLKSSAYITDLGGGAGPVPLLSIGLILLVSTLFLVIAYRSKRYRTP